MTWPPGPASPRPPSTPGTAGDAVPAPSASATPSDIDEARSNDGSTSTPTPHLSPGATTVTRPELPLGTWGRIRREEVGPNRFRARARFRDYDGHTRDVEAW